MVYADDQTDDCPVTVEVIEDHVFLTGRLEDDPEKVVQVAVPWRDLAGVLNRSC